MAAPLFIAGATATGKSAVAMEIAREVGGEIISVDSMQVYSGMDIGTAKPSQKERAEVPHHLIDIKKITEPFDAAAFVEAAGEALGKMETPIFCGGTGLYFQAWQEGLGTAPGADQEMRKELEATEISELVAELREKDEVTYREIDRQNKRRLVRAVEVLRQTGKPFSAQRAKWKGKVPANFFLIQREPEDLRSRINERVEGMFAQGLVEETRAILPDLGKNKTAQQALGYKQVIEHDKGERDLPATLALVKSRTWQFARRQQTWFRKMEGTIPIGVSKEETPAHTARRILESIR